MRADQCLPVPQKHGKVLLSTEQSTRTSITVCNSPPFLWLHFNRLLLHNFISVELFIAAFLRPESVFTLNCYLTNQGNAL